jgi:hypothetical protein
MLEALTAEWRRLSAVMERLLEDISPEGGNRESD